MKNKSIDNKNIVAIEIKNKAQLIIGRFIDVIEPESTDLIYGKSLWLYPAMLFDGQYYQEFSYQQKDGKFGYFFPVNRITKENYYLGRDLVLTKINDINQQRALSELENILKTC